MPSTRSACRSLFRRLNVKLVGSHAGISIGEDGPSQMGIEDVGPRLLAAGTGGLCSLRRCLHQGGHRAMVTHNGPTYLRVGRGKVADIYPDGVKFEIGKAIETRSGSDITIIANGLMVAAAVDAATILAKEKVSVRVLDLHTIKPVDRDAIAKAAKETGAIVVAEEHLHHGGLGSVVAQVVGETHPVPMGFVNVGDLYAESGDPQGLLDKYGLTSENVAIRARETLARKSR